ncbi:PREDICTED: centromere protein L [Gekko japonicus]|uniref:Centromere protein L n=1 Tax=Gekko japonicus TaxID=146911 RepID=A0ABM1JX79_GEKJA|nr:PREDICTED: centromere protein L [Gekko japonicus]
MDVARNQGTDSGGKAMGHGTNFINTAHLSRGRISLKRGNLFGQTPAKRRLLQTPHLQENADAQIGFLLRKQLTLYSVSPLYKFSYDRLQEYSRQLCFVIAAEKQKGLAVHVEGDLKFKVKFSMLSVLKTSEQNEAGVLIQVGITVSPSSLPPSALTQVTAENAGPKVVWTGCFCCTRGNDILETVVEDFTCLPLFLVNGAESLSAIIGTWLQQTFDCSFSLLTISPLNLAWMAAMWTGYKMERHKGAVELTFSVPGTPQPLDISYAIHAEDAKALWDSIHTTQQEVRQEQVDLFMDGLCYHFYRHFKIYLSATRLAKVSTSVASAHANGKIKILHSAYLVEILALMTELAISKIL